MKKLLFAILILISFQSFGQGSWGLTGTKNRWANGMGFGNKDTSTYVNASDANLLVLQYPGLLCYRHLVTDFWQILAAAPSGSGFVTLTRFSDSLTAVRSRINGAGVLTNGVQPNITSVGTLGSLNVTGTINAGTLSATNATVSNNLTVTNSITTKTLTIDSAIIGTTIAKGFLSDNVQRFSAVNYNPSNSIALVATNYAASGSRSIAGVYIQRQNGAGGLYDASFHGYGADYPIEFFRGKSNLTDDAGRGLIIRSQNSGNSDSARIHFVAGATGGSESERMRIINNLVSVYTPLAVSGVSNLNGGANVSGGNFTANAGIFSSGVRINANTEPLILNRTLNSDESSIRLYNAGILKWLMGLGSGNNNIRLYNNISGNNSLTLDSMDNATFAGTVTAVAFIPTSDIRQKEIIQRYKSNNGLDVYKFKWKPGLKRDTLTHWGYSAQEVKKHKDVSGSAFIDEKTGGVNYDEVHTYEIMLLKKELAELRAEIKELKKRKQ
jgi:hypothetical protein